MTTRRPGLLAALVLALSACAGPPQGPGDTTPSPVDPTSAASTTLPSPSRAPSSGPTGTESPTTSAPTGQVITATPPPAPTGEDLRPQPSEAFDDRPHAYDEDCQNTAGTEVLTCDYGALDGEVTVALVGDSKALQWISALDRIGRERGWHVVTMTKSTCTWADAYVSADQRPDTECWRWGQKASQKVLDLEPDLAVTSFGHTMAAPDDSSTEFSREALVAGLVSTWQELADAEIPVAALSDTPSSGALGDIPECVGTHREDPSACTLDQAEGIGTPPMREAVRQVPSTTLVDLTDVLCPGGTCRPVFGDVLVQRDTSHVTDTFVREVTPALDEPLSELVGGGA